MKFKPMKKPATLVPSRLLLKVEKKKKETKQVCLWKGPQEDGITQSLLCKFLVCRERFRLRVVEGLKEQEEWKHYLHYGSMWHICEEHYAGGTSWTKQLAEFCNELKDQYPGNEADIDKWSLICKMQFPLYVAFWKNHREKSVRTPLLQEVPYRFRYYLPSGRYVVLRGKFDSVDLYDRKAIYLQENKTKGDIDQEGLQSTIDQNIQTMIYQIALRRINRQNCDDITPMLPVVNLVEKKKAEIAGVIYNVVRRPLSDRFAIKQKKKETLKAFIARIQENILAAPSKVFFRWNASIRPSDVTRFETQCLIPILEQLCDWWESIHANPFNPWETSPSFSKSVILQNKHHYRFPFGVYNSLTGGMRGDYFEYLTSNRRHNLVKIDTLFPEL